MRRIDAHLSKQVRHAECARLVRNDGHDSRAKRFVFQEIAEETDGGLGRGHLLALGSKSEFRVSTEQRHCHTCRASPAPRQIAAESLAARAKIAKLGAVFGRLVKFERGGL